RSWCTARRSRAVLPGDCSGRRRPVSIPSVTSLLLAQDFPPMGGGIARLHGEMARHFPRGELVVSTPLDSDAPDVDAQFAAAVDRLPVSRGRTKTLPGLLLWSRRAASLARQHRVRFVHCGNVKPAGYPARWVYERCRVPYGIFFHGGDLLSEQHKVRQSRFKRRSTRAILGGAAVLMANSAWTRDLALTVLGELGLDGHGQRLRVVHLGTDPGRFRPGVDATELRGRLELPHSRGRNGTRWLLTVERIGVEGFGISLVEASACGLPVVAGNSGGVPDAVRDGETGFLVPPEDPAAFSDAICRLLADDELARRVGAAGRRAVETYYNWDRVVRDLRALEAEVVAR